MFFCFVIWNCLVCCVLLVFVMMRWIVFCMFCGICISCCRSRFVFVSCRLVRLLVLGCGLMFVLLNLVRFGLWFFWVWFCWVWLCFLFDVGECVLMVIWVDVDVCLGVIKDMLFWVVDCIMIIVMLVVNCFLCILFLCYIKFMVVLVGFDVVDKEIVC